MNEFPGFIIAALVFLQQEDTILQAREHLRQRVDDFRSGMPTAVMRTQ